MNLFNIDIEKSILSTLMQHDNIIAEKSVELSPSDFYAGRHQVIFGAIIDLHKNHMGYDVLMVAEYLESRNDLDKAGGEEYLTDILSQLPSVFNLASYIERLRDLSVRRQVKTVIDESVHDVANADKAVTSTVNDIIGKLNNTAVTSNQATYELVGNLCHDFLDQFRAKVKGEVKAFVETGFIELDNKINLKKGDLCIIAGRPSMGKSTLAQNILTTITRITDKTSVFFSLEMDKQLVMERLISAVGSVNLTTIMSGGANCPKGEPTEHDWQGLTIGMNFLKNIPLIIDDKPKITVGEIRAKLNKIRHDEGELSIVVVDYIGLMGDVQVATDRNNAIGYVTGELKAIARDFNCPVIALSQLNRGVESRPDKRPIMSDLRDSGSIEQDADKIIAVYRDEYYNKDSKEKGIAEAIVLKNRNGATGTVRLGFEGQYSRFTELMPTAQEWGEQ